MSAQKTGTLYWLPRILSDERLDAVETLLLVALADHVDAHDTAYPSVETLAARARCSYATARRRLASLEKRGILVRERRRNEHTGNLSTYRYRLIRTDEPDALDDNLSGSQRSDCHLASAQQVSGSQRSPGRAVASAHLGARAEVPRVEVPSTKNEGAAEVVAAFEQFWQSWTPVGEGRGKGPKKAARDRFAKLGPKLRERMTRTTNAYLAMCQRDQRPTVDCSTWLGSSDKGWRAWEDQLADEAQPEVRDDFEHLPPQQWAPAERGIVERILLERPPDMWEPAALRLLIHERPAGTTVQNALGPVPWPPATHAPPVDAPDEVLLDWWRNQRRTDAA